MYTSHLIMNHPFDSNGIEKMEAKLFIKAKKIDRLWFLWYDQIYCQASVAVSVAVATIVFLSPKEKAFSIHSLSPKFKQQNIRIKHDNIIKGETYFFFKTYRLSPIHFYNSINEYTRPYTIYGIFYY